MKKILLLLNLFICYSLFSQITLKECVTQGLLNKSNIKTAKTDLLLANLKVLEAKGKYIPQISLMYDYRYNAIIPSQIVPVGQFNPVPTNETKSIQFGTNWQQNAGISAYQPIIDLTLQSRIKESKIKEALSNIDLEKAENDLMYEITKTYSHILNFNYQLEEAVEDTLRSSISYHLVNSKFKEGKILKTEFNNAIINHNNNLVNYKSAAILLLNEKIYIHYLTNIDLEKVLGEKFEAIPPSIFLTIDSSSQINIENTIEFKKLLSREELISQQIKTETKSFLPTIGLDGFLGANQFAENFNLFERNQWFGNSYIAFSAKLPITTSNKSINAKKQLKTQQTVINYEREELINNKKRQMLQINLEIEKLKYEIKTKKANLVLQNENLNLYKLLLQNGQFIAAELNEQEVNIQKIKAQINQLNEQLNKTFSEKLYVTGELSNKLKTL